MSFWVGFPVGLLTNITFENMVFQKKAREIFGKPKFTNIPCWKSGPTNFQPKFGFLVTEEGFYFLKKNAVTRNRQNHSNL